MRSDSLVTVSVSVWKERLAAMEATNVVIDGEVLLAAAFNHPLAVPSESEVELDLSFLIDQRGHYVVRLALPPGTVSNITQVILVGHKDLQ